MAQREELDQMYETGKQAFGKSFEIYLKLNDVTLNPSGANSARYMREDYEW